MEAASFGRVNALGGKKRTQTNGSTILDKNSFFRRRRFKISRSAQLQFFFLNVSEFLKIVDNRGFPANHSAYSNQE
jgi:hypothetical protein